VNRLSEFLFGVARSSRPPAVHIYGAGESGRHARLLLRETYRDPLDGDMMRPAHGKDISLRYTDWSGLTGSTRRWGIGPFPASYIASSDF